ncbi:MAG: GGDEF domain-containing protein [Candidatus Moraniibacteriota bacterium]
MQQIVREPESIIAFLSRIIRDAVRILAFGSATEEELTTKERELVTQEELDRRDYDNLVLARRLIEQNREIVDLREENAVLKRVAMLDHLTRLYNRHGGKIELDRALAPYMRQAHGLSTDQPQPLHHMAVVVVDMDNFKSINDSHGHDAGDRALVAVARHLKRAFRADDIITRWGGDEFVVYVIGATQDAVLKRAQLLVREMKEDTTLYIDPWSVTCSIGIAHGEFISSERGTAHQLIELLRVAADTAMYKAKQEIGPGSCIATAPDNFTAV